MRTATRFPRAFTRVSERFMNTWALAFKLSFLLAGMYLAVRAYRVNLIVVRIRARRDRLPRINRILEEQLGSGPIDFDEAMQYVTYFAGALLVIGAFMPA